MRRDHHVPAGSCFARNSSLLPRSSHDPLHPGQPLGHREAGREPESQRVEDDRFQHVERAGFLGVMRAVVPMLDPSARKRHASSTFQISNGPHGLLSGFSCSVRPPYSLSPRYACTRVITHGSSIGSPQKSVTSLRTSSSVRCWPWVVSTDSQNGASSHSIAPNRSSRYSGI